MRETLYTEDQRLGKSQLRFVTGVFVVLALLPVTSLISGHPFGVWHVLAWLGLIGVWALTRWYLRRVQLRLEVNDKQVRVQTSNISGEQERVKWKDVESIELHKLPRGYRAQGWNVQFSSGNAWYNLDGKAVLRIRKKDGREILIGCRHRKKLRKALNQEPRTRALLNSRQAPDMG